MRVETEKYTSGEKKDQPKTFTNKKHTFGEKETQSLEVALAFPILESVEEVKQSAETDENLVAFVNLALRDYIVRDFRNLDLGANATRESVIEAANKLSSKSIAAFVTTEEKERFGAKKKIDAIKEAKEQMTKGEITLEDYLAIVDKYTA